MIDRMKTEKDIILYLSRRKKDIMREAKEQMNIKSKAEERLRKEEEERRAKAEDEMRKQILIEMENKSIQDAAQNLRVCSKLFG